MWLNIQRLYYVVMGFIAIASVSFTVFKASKRASRRRDIDHVFISDMATNHLPHIYTALTIIGVKLNVDIPTHPKVKFLDAKDFEG